MSENTSNQIQQPNGKPVNINISFNISRKQVTQNINSLDHEKSFNLRNTNNQENLTTNNKPKIHSSRPLKTPQLAQTDRHIYSKDLQNLRATQQLKRKKKRKRNSVDYTNDKSTHMAFYPVDLDKSLPTHKRGYTTTIMKKNQSTMKNKKQSSKTNQNIKQNETVPISSLLNQGTKADGKTLKLQKNLKTILNKLINNELSKRSLPLPSVPSKSKYNQSTALTARKVSTARPSKKRSSKSHIITKERANSSSNINSSGSEMQIFQNPKILQKLGNFKSIQNSVLVSQADQNDDNQQFVNKLKPYQQKRIVIKTDQSIECIGEIHDWEKNFYQEQFFQQPKKTKNNFMNKKPQQQKNTSGDTLSLIQTYVKLLNSPDEEIYQPEHNERRSNSRIHHNVNERVQIYEESQRHMSTEDYQKIEDLLRSSKNKSKYQEFQEQMYQSNRWQGRNENFVKQVHSKVVEKIVEQYVNQGKNHLNQQKKQQQQTLISPPKQPHPTQKQQEDFKPFISSQMGRQYHYNQIINTEQRQKLNELKKHEFEKWSCLLDYIKSNINSETSTQQVLQQVYDYLSKAKVDLIKQGENITQGQSASLNGINRIEYYSNNKMTKEKLEQEFTNKLSSQIEKSTPQIINPNQTQSDQVQLNSYKKSKQFHSNKRKLGQLKRSQQEEILDEQTKSFKEDYQSSVQEESLKFMNLSTIETALKNRFNQLCHKKDKELQHLQSLYEQNKLTQEDYEKQKNQLETLFKKQTNEILSVKKNIWKGYNEAKGILDKSYITSRVQQEFGSMLYNRYEGGSSDRKDRKMMKCLSQSYLGKKKIDYKKFIEQEQRKKQQQIQQDAYKRQIGQAEQESSDYENQEQQYYGRQQSQPSQSRSQSKQQYPHQQSQSQHSEDQQHQDRHEDESYQQGDQNDSRVYNHYTNQQREEDLNVSQKKSVDEEFEKIAQKINKLKQQHDVAIAQQQSHINKPLSKQLQQESSHEKQNLKIINNDVNEFDISDHKYSDENIATSPVLVSASPDSSMHYEEIERSLHAYSDEQSVSDEDMGSQKSDQQQSQSNKQSQQHSQKEQYSDDDEQNINIRDNKNNKTIENHSQQQHYSDDDEQYSDQEREIIDRELAQESSKMLKNNISPPLKSSVNQKHDHQLQQPKVKAQQTLQKQKKQQDPKIKALTKKFKYLTQEDRQDIFQFLFLDLCIELYQQPCHENKLMDAINKHVAKQHQMSKRKKGVKTNLNVVKDYLKRFCGYLLRTNKQALDNMNVPMGPTAIQMLKYMHENQDFDDGQVDQNDGVVTLIVPVSIFDTFERSLLPTLEFEKYYDNQEKQHERVNFLKNILHIHNKALFDALNQYLDQQRPFGIWGKPFPWKKSSTFSHKFTEIEQQQKLKKSAQKVVQACSYVCGLLVDKQQSLVGNAKISQGYIQQIREDRISRMLANQMIENEDRWVFYDDEQTQVLVETSNFVYNTLLKEIMQDLAGIIMK